MHYPQVIAHRCGGVLAAENSLAGLAAAARIGCRGVEFDTMLSADGVPVLMHDDTVDRTTSGHGAVARLTVADLRRLNLRGEPVPLLAEALARCAELGLWANIEIKAATGCDETELGRVVARTLAEGWDGHGVISSFSVPALLAAKSQPSRHGMPRMGYASYALLVDDLPPDWQALVREVNAIAVHMDATYATPEKIAAVRETGRAVACYTVNERIEAERLLTSGATAIFTDHPEFWATPVA
jgi:glycerophosphoryl diester phosphodiesterase